MSNPHKKDEPTKCAHGYWLHALEKCPWCLGLSEEQHNCVPVRGDGNGWLLKRGDLVCLECGGPRQAGWGGWVGPEEPTPERVRAALEEMQFCYQCTTDGADMERSNKTGDLLTEHELVSVANACCPDCGKSPLTPYRDKIECPRLVCGAEFSTTRPIARLRNRVECKPTRR